MATATQTQQIQVTCITKPNRLSSFEGITHIGGVGWKWPIRDVIAELESPAPRYSFFISVRGHRSEIGVVDGPTGKYLRSFANRRWDDNLLSLNECP